jgi:hypothetical protein
LQRQSVGVDDLLDALKHLLLLLLLGQVKLIQQQPVAPLLWKATVKGWGLILKEFLPSILTCPRRSSMERTSEFQSAPPPPH